MQTETRLHTNAPIPTKNWKVWWKLTRPHTLSATFVPVLLGTALAIQHTNINIFLFLAMMVTCMFLQIATNMFNEYYDYKRGLDTEESIGIGGAIVREGVKPSTVLKAALTLYGLSVLLGVYICMNSSWWLAVVGVIGMSAGYLYTGGPYPIAYTPFGEIVAGFFMGMLFILISFYIQVGTVTVDSVLISIPFFLLVGAILLANNIRDYDGDKEFGRKTLAILLGREKAVYLLGAMFIISYLWIFFLIIARLATPWLAIVILSIPKAVKATKGFIGKTKPIQMMPAMKATSQTNTLFGFLLTAGLFISYFF